MTTAAEPPLLAVSIVVFNDARTIIKTVEALINSDGFSLGKNLRLWITDNASTDQSRALLGEHFGSRFGIELLFSPVNLGFCAAHNRALELALASGAESVLVLNPDLKLKLDALLKLHQALEADPQAGMCCPKLLRANEDLNPREPLLLDAAGMFITPQLRHFDRGSNQPPSAEHLVPSYVFGASGAAVLMRKEFIQDCDIAQGSPLELFDEAFFAYREDADLSWRALRLGWKCRYVPEAEGAHLRRVLPENRAQLKPELNRYSVRNRFLLQLNNLTPLTALKCLSGLLLRNSLVIGAVLTKERSSLPALREVLSSAARARMVNRSISARAKTTGLAVSKWFSSVPWIEPALAVSPARLERIAAVTALVINYNSGRRLINCLSALAAAAEQLVGEVDVQIVVVDNASADSSLRAAQEAFAGTGRVLFKPLDENSGFAGGINLGAAAKPADAYLVMNPDVKPNAAAIAALVRALERYPELGQVAPLLRGEDGSLQTRYSFRRLPLFGSAVVEVVGLHRLIPANPWTKHLYREDEHAPRGRSDTAAPVRIVEQPAAACLLIRRADFDTLGGFDQAFYPAWFEDVDFAARLNRRGRMSGVCTTASVVHEGGYSLNAVPRLQFRSIWNRNLRRYWQKHGTGFQYGALTLLLPCAELLRSTPTLLFGSRAERLQVLKNLRELFMPLERSK